MTWTKEKICFHWWFGHFKPLFLRYGSDFSGEFQQQKEAFVLSTNGHLEGTPVVFGFEVRAGARTTCLSNGIQLPVKTSRISNSGKHEFLEYCLSLVTDDVVTLVGEKQHTKHT